VKIFLVSFVLSFCAVVLIWLKRHRGGLGPAQSAVIMSVAVGIGAGAVLVNEALVSPVGDLIPQICLVAAGTILTLESGLVFAYGETRVLD